MNGVWINAEVCGQVDEASDCNCNYESCQAGMIPLTGLSVQLP